MTFRRSTISTCELEPGGPRYTVDTLFLLGEKHDDLTLLVGAISSPASALARARHDSGARRAGRRQPTWLRRREAGAGHCRAGAAGARSFFSIPPHPISSHEIRARVSGGRPIDGLVPLCVAAEIDRLGLYRE